MKVLSNVKPINYSDRELILGKYYPLTFDEGTLLIEAGQGRDLINFVSDGPYKYLWDISI